MHSRRVTKGREFLTYNPTPPFHVLRVVAFDEKISTDYQFIFINGTVKVSFNNHNQVIIIQRVTMQPSEGNSNKMYIQHTTITKKPMTESKNLNTDREGKKSIAK